MLILVKDEDVRSGTKVTACQGQLQTHTGINGLLTGNSTKKRNTPSPNHYYKRDIINVLVKSTMSFKDNFYQIQ